MPGNQLSQAFVRTGMLDAKQPPAGETGLILWIRKNLLSSWLNIILTVLVAYAALRLALGLWPWFSNSVWQASSLADCRTILAEQGLGPTDGACFAVVTDRWHQLIFGFYPTDLYWRPILAMILFLGGIAPILFFSLPRSLLIFSCLAPFVCFWLLWGGTAWLPLLIVAGLAGGYALTRFVGAVISPTLTGLVTLALLIGFFWFGLMPLVGLMEAGLSLSIRPVASREFGGFMLAATIGLSAIVLSLPLGVLLALARQSDLPLIKWSAIIFIEVVRGVPLIVWLFTAQLLLNYFLPPGTSFDLTLRVIIMVTLFAAAYIAEVIRGGLVALPKGQHEGAVSLGLSYWQSRRLIILPQALKISIPGIVNEFIGLFKDTTLVVFIGLLDPIGVTRAIRATPEWNGVYWELFIFVGLLFYVVCYAMARYSLHLENLLRRDNY
ncbi:amino acid ABC transporter permease [uncultured Roseibium sp.]|uniref:amino acid ABC transporter permease n=1 Tax=uncultured Roseibium sp. TaxID=1936171 RepID=UPI002616D82E|nr:amino acid ABC transporter permease [uncultured Roseibium sp.]